MRVRQGEAADEHVLREPVLLRAGVSVQGAVRRAGGGRVESRRDSVFDGRGPAPVEHREHVDDDEADTEGELHDSADGERRVPGLDREYAEGGSEGAAVDGEGDGAPVDPARG